MREGAYGAGAESAESVQKKEQESRLESRLILALGPDARMQAYEAAAVRGRIDYFSYSPSPSSAEAAATYQAHPSSTFY